MIRIDLGAIALFKEPFYPLVLISLIVVFYFAQSGRTCHIEGLQRYPEAVSKTYYSLVELLEFLTVIGFRLHLLNLGGH